MDDKSLQYIIALADAGYVISFRKENEKLLSIRISNPKIGTDEFVYVLYNEATIEAELKQAVDIFKEKVKNV